MITSPNTTHILCYGGSNMRGWVPGKMGAERYGLQTLPIILTRKKESTLLPGHTKR